MGEGARRWPCAAMSRPSCEQSWGELLRTKRWPCAHISHSALGLAAQPPALHNAHPR